MELRKLRIKYTNNVVTETLQYKNESGEWVNVPIVVEVKTFGNPNGKAPFSQ